MSVGGVAPTITLAEVAPPVPPSTDVTAPLVLFFAPDVVAVTFTLNVHEPVAASVAPVKLILPDPPAAVIEPPPQLPVSPVGAETTTPNGNVSVKPTPVRALLALGLVIVKLSDVVPPTGRLAARKDAIVGGPTGCGSASAD
jgi:hypothetical protein